MRKIDDEIQLLLKEHRGNIREILDENRDLDCFYALSPQRDLLLEWYDFETEAELLQVGADYGAMTGLFRTSVREVTVLDADADALKTVELRFPGAANIRYERDCLTSFVERAEKSYDYVVLAGTLTAPYAENIRAAKRLLKPDGVLIVACANALGMKYFAGSRPEPDALTKKQLAELLSEDGGEERFYYPMPDYRTPVSIYSDDYLPKKGDLTRVTPAYDYPPYHMMDMGEKFDAVCEADVFDLYANSYLGAGVINGSVGRLSGSMSSTIRRDGSSSRSRRASAGGLSRKCGLKRRQRQMRHTPPCGSAMWRRRL